MLEVRELVKIYATKGGESVRAVDGISLRFDETGMVFLLGKSGSGKSTLLNLCGGLDVPDEGEIIIKGRSSKDFTPADFDSYRNTYVGFVFQEYNILEEFTVEDNIALALELQGRGRDKARVEEILQQVDLAGYGKRRPNTLSGGQRQRVAIARALVKDPEIIMADEPTGALESDTGKQVLETLKKLSENKLVLVVTHDRDFAETYGDRIIELKDGKVISDVSRTTRGGGEENVRFAGDVVCVRSGARLTQDDLEKINAFLSAQKEDVVITAQKEDVARVREEAHFGEVSAAEFAATDERRIAAKTYTPEESRLIRSRLPLSRALRIGASSIRVKPFRLVVTILLCVVAFTMFGLFSTLTFFSRTETSIRTYRNLGYEMLPLQNHYRTYYTSYRNGVEEGQSTRDFATFFSQTEYEELQQTFGPDTLGIYNYSNFSVSGKFTPSNVRSPSYSAGSYYQAGLSGVAAVDPASAYWTDKLVTDTDLASLGENDVVISTYTFESIRHYGLYTSYDFAEKIDLEDYGDIIGKQLIMPSLANPAGAAFTVRGVYRNDLPSDFDALKDPSQEQTQEQAAQALLLQRRLDLELDYGMYDVGLVSDAFYEAHRVDFGNPEPNVDPAYMHARLGKTYFIFGSAAGNRSRLGFFSDAYFYPPDRGDTPALIARLDGGPANTPLADGEIIVSFDVLLAQAEPIAQAIYRRMLNEAGSDGELRIEAENWLASVSDATYLLRVGAISGKSGTPEEYAAALSLLFPILDEAGKDGIPAYDAGITISTDPAGASASGEYTIVGFYYGADNDHLQDAVYFSEGDYQNLYARSYENMGEEEVVYSISETKYRQPADARYQRIFIRIPDTNRSLRALLSTEGEPDAMDDTFFTVDSLVTYQIDDVSDTIDLLALIFLGVGVVMAVFAMLLLFNFISVSISNKKKEIGILRAVGARGTDVFKIFFAESALIGIICYVLSAIACVILCNVINAYVATLLPVALFVFGPLSWLVMFAIALLTCFLATLLPVRSAAKRSPVESIRAI